MVHVQNSTLAGGVAVGSVCNLLIGAHGAILIGIIAGTVSVMGYRFISVSIVYMERVCMSMYQQTCYVCATKYIGNIYVRLYWLGRLGQHYIHTELYTKQILFIKVHMKLFESRKLSS